MDIARRLQDCEEFARGILQDLEALDGLEAADPLDPEIERALKELTAATRQAHRDAVSPVKIGVVGEFNVGKTLLLGSLIGYADGLPVVEVPTTGNITWIRFRPVDQVATTEFSDFDVEYLDLPGAEKCLAFMLAEMKRAAASEVLSSELQQRAAQLNSADPQVWSAVEDWCRAAWSVKSRRIRLLARELVMFVRAFHSCGMALCHKPRRFTIPADAARDALSLPSLEHDLLVMGFDDLWNPTIRLETQPVSLTPEMLRASFVLIRRVEVVVKLSRRVWDMQALSGSTEFVMIDFPGLGATGTGARDRYLGLRELEDVQTILVMLDSRKPGGSGGVQEFITHIQSSLPNVDVSDRVLVGLGRFDELPLKDQGLKALERLTDSDEMPMPALSSAVSELVDDEPLTLDDLQPDEPSGISPRLTEVSAFAALAVLSAAVAGAESLTHRRDRLVLLCPLLGLSSLAERYNVLRVGSPLFLKHLPADARVAADMAARWTRLAERLRRYDPESQLGRWLREFSIDGGIGRLRTLIATHVGERGLKQLFDKVRVRIDAVERVQTKLRAALASTPAVKTPSPSVPSSGSSGSLVELRKAVGDLAKKYSSLCDQFKKVPPDLHTSCGDAERSETVADLVERACVYEVCEWKEWKELLECSRNGRLSIVDDDSAGSGGLEDVPMPWGSAAAVEGHSTTPRQVPTRSENFVGPFEATIRRLEERTLAEVRAAAKARMERLDNELAALRDDLSPLLGNSEACNRFLTRAGSEGDKYLRGLGAGSKPSVTTDMILDRSRLSSKHYKPIDVGQLFPLPRSDSGRQQGRTFAWAPELQERTEREFRPDDSHRHMIKAPQLRDTFIEATVQAMAQVISQATKDVNQRTLEMFSGIRDSLQSLVSQEKILAGMASSILHPSPSTDTGPAVGPGEEPLGSPPSDLDALLVRLARRNSPLVQPSSAVAHNA
jgi:hypothetical protein